MATPIETADESPEYQAWKAAFDEGYRIAWKDAHDKLTAAVEALERASITFSIIAADRGNIARTCDDATRSSDLLEKAIADLQTPASSDGAARFATPELLNDFFAGVERYNNKLNDPKGNGTGDEARAPTGCDYNELLDLIESLRSKVGG